MMAGRKRRLRVGFNIYDNRQLRRANAGHLSSADMLRYDHIPPAEIDC